MHFCAAHFHPTINRWLAPRMWRGTWWFCSSSLLERWWGTFRGTFAGIIKLQAQIPGLVHMRALRRNRDENRRTARKSGILSRFWAVIGRQSMAPMRQCRLWPTKVRPYLWCPAFCWKNWSMCSPAPSVEKIGKSGNREKTANRAATAQFWPFQEQFSPFLDKTMPTEHC